LTHVNVDRYELFCLEFVKDFKGGAAARRAGVSDGSARSWASRALDKPEVIERIAQLKAERRQRVEVEADDVLRPLASIAATDVTDLVEFRRYCCRHCWGAGFGYQRTAGEFKAARARHGKEQARAQREGRDLAEELEAFDEKGGPGFVATRDPNPDCPECFGEGMGVPFIRDTREMGAGATAAYAGVKVTKDGIEVKMHDRLKAIELLGKHLGLFTDNVNVKGHLTVSGLAGRMRARGSMPGSDLA
jgi:phage terminase small subunit